jgi:hypothetical protein
MKPFHKIRRFALIGLVAILPVFSGCVAIVAAGAGAGAYAYLKGSMESHLNASLESSMVAVRSTMKKQNLIKVKETSDIRSARFVYRDTADTRISIALDQKQPTLTEIKVRVGAVGDETRSLEILKNINAQL